MSKKNQITDVGRRVGKRFEQDVRVALAMLVKQAGGELKLKRKYFMDCRGEQILFSYNEAGDMLINLARPRHKKTLKRLQNDNTQS